MGTFNYYDLTVLQRMLIKTYRILWLMLSNQDLSVTCFLFSTNFVMESVECVSVQHLA